MANFDENKVISPLHTEKAKIGERYWCADSLIELKKTVEQELLSSELKEVHKSNYCPCPFEMETSATFQFIYPCEKTATKRMTNVQFSEWLARGNGVYKNKNLGQYIYIYYEFPEQDSNKEIDEIFVIRPFGQEEWIIPSVDIYNRDCKKTK